MSISTCLDFILFYTKKHLTGSDGLLTRSVIPMLGRTRTLTRREHDVNRTGRSVTFAFDSGSAGSTELRET
jgi:hypothetical protein